MLEELAPEIIWISGLGTVVVFGLMMVVWFLSTRESGVKKDEISLAGPIQLKPMKRKKQYGSPRKKKESNEGTTITAESVVDKFDETDETVPHVTESHNSQLSSQSQQQSSKEDTGPTKRPKSSDQHAKESTTTHAEVQQPLPVVKKAKTKIKQSASSSADVGVMPGSQIAEFVVNSTLSDEEIQLVMEKLLEKQDEEWEATSRADNVKMLKKANEELTSRCHDAEKSAQLHSKRVKELSSELKQERARSAMSENSFQAKIAKQQEDIESSKKKLQQYRHEVEQLKEKDNTNEHDRLEESNKVFRQQLAQMASDKSQLSAQLTDQARKFQELQDANDRLSQKASKCNSDVKKLEMEKKQLQKELQSIDNEKAKLLSELDSTTDRLDRASEEHMTALQQLRDSHTLQQNEMKTQAALKLQEMTNAFHQLEAERDRRVAESSSLQNENSSLKEKLHDLQEQVKILHADRTNVNGQIMNQESTTPDSNNSNEDEVIQLKKDAAEMQRKIEELKLKNDKLRDNSWKARDELETLRKEHKKDLEETQRQHKAHIDEVTEKATREEHDHQKAFLVSLFPELHEKNDQNFSDWIKNAGMYISDKFNRKDEEIGKMKKEVEEGSQLTDNLRDTLADTLAKLEDLMEKWEEKERKYTSTIEEETLHRTQVEQDLKMTKENLEKLLADHNSVASQVGSLEREKEALLHQLSEKPDAESLQLAIEQERNLKATVMEEMEKAKEGLRKMEEHMSNLASKNSELTERLRQCNDEINDYKEKLQENEKLVDSLRAANQDFNQRFSKLSPPPSVSTSSEV